MNTAPEYVALERLGYREVKRRELDETAKNIRQNHKCLLDLKFCAETFKHVRKLDPPKQAAPFTTTATSTGISAHDQTTWKIESHDPLEVLRQAYATLAAYAELK